PIRPGRGARRRARVGLLDQGTRGAAAARIGPVGASVDAAVAGSLERAAGGARGAGAAAAGAAVVRDGAAANGLAAARLFLPAREPPALRRRRVRLGTLAAVLPAGLPGRGLAVVAAAPAGAAAAAARAERPTARGLDESDAGAAQPFSRQDRLLPAAVLPGGLASDRALAARGVEPRRERRRARGA